MNVHQNRRMVLRLDTCLQPNNIGCFARDTNYLLFLHNTQMKYIKQNEKSVYSFVNLNQLKNAIKKQEVNIMIQNNEILRFMEPFHDTPAFWERTTRDLFAMLRQLGTPNIFCTFSVAEMRWQEIIEAAKSQQIL